MNESQRRWFIEVYNLTIVDFSNISELITFTNINQFLLFRILLSERKETQA